MPELRRGKKERERFLRELEPLWAGLYRTALRMTRDATRAEDVVQEAVLKAWRFFGTFKIGTNFAAWMHRVLYTVFVNTTRDKEPRAAPLEAVAEPAEALPEIESALRRPTAITRAEAVLESVDDRIKQAVQELPADLRWVFLLNTVEGLKYREIAEVLDCPIGTVMSRLFRSRQFLQERLAEYAGEVGFSTDGEISVIPHEL